MINCKADVGGPGMMAHMHCVLWGMRDIAYVNGHVTSTMHTPALRDQRFTKKSICVKWAIDSILQKLFMP